MLGVRDEFLMAIRVMHRWTSAQNGTRRVDGHLHHILGQLSVVIGCTSCVKTDLALRACRRRLSPIPTKSIVQSSWSEFLYRRILLLYLDLILPLHNRTERHSAVLVAMTPRWVECVGNLRRQCRRVILFACSVNRNGINLRRVAARFRRLHHASHLRRAAERITTTSIA